MKRIAAFVLVLLLLPAVVLADLEVHFLDVGQGDCAIVLCDGQSMVIDGGPGGTNGNIIFTC
jgi:competence protein ComEC